MSAATPQRHDVFISYASVDDQVDPASERPGASPGDRPKGWVTTLVRQVSQLLSKKLGRAERFSVWMDNQLTGNAELTPALLNALQASDTILLVLSPGYVASEWCRRELSSFVKHLQQRGLSRERIFIVYHHRVDVWPEELADKRFYQFWRLAEDGHTIRMLGWPRPNPDRDQDYYELVNRLACELAEVLKRPPGELPVPPGGPADAGPAQITVCLADATDDLEDQRESVKTYLRQHGIRVLPEFNYSRDAGFEQAVRRDLASAKLFVQLLSDVRGSLLPGQMHRFVAFQHGLAQELHKPVFAWRHRELATSRVTDPEYRAFLEGPTVAAEGLEEFKARVLQAALAPPPPPPRPRPPGARRQSLIFINASPDDMDFARQLQRACAQRGAICELPAACQNREEFEQDLRENVLYCDGLMLVYGRSPSTWVRGQLRLTHKLASQRDDLPVVGVYEGPPPVPPKESLNVLGGDLQLLHGLGGVDENELQKFLEAVDQRAGV